MVTPAKSENPTTIGKSLSLAESLEQDSGSASATSKPVKQSLKSPLTKLALPVRSRAKVVDNASSGSPLWPFLRHALQEPRARRNHNTHDVVNSALDRSWYIPSPKCFEKDHPDYLCENCRHIDLEYLFCRSVPRQTVDPDDYIRLGPMQDIMQELACPLCKVVSRTVTAKLERDPEQSIITGVKVKSPLTANWYLSPFVYSHEEIGPGYRLFLRFNIREQDCDPESAEDTTYLAPSWPFALRLVKTEPKGGRCISADHLDFGWIRRTIELCEISTDMPPRNFECPIRAIDVQDMCIVDLGSVNRYVALSYAWGNAKMAKLVEANESFLRTPGYLDKLNNIPYTIQDAMVLVRNVGERYLWVDNLCILQDNEFDLKRQMRQMGQLYTHSYFTIFAISGQDANHGLPGVRPSTRKLRQFVQQVGNLTVANSLPWMDGEDLLRAGAWGSRGWTFQERFRSQRAVLIGDEGMIINCTHTYSPEDEHCFHTVTRNKKSIARGNWIFFTGQDKRCIPYLAKLEPFDNYSMYVFEYSRRSLTYEVDVLTAFLGILQHLQVKLLCRFIHGLPEAELDAALLWSPLGANTRRYDPVTEQPLFPSWSWFGWVGPAAYPWTLERDTFMSTVNSPLQWQDAAIASDRAVTNRNGANELHPRKTGDQEEPGANDSSWFTSDDFCLPSSPARESLLASFRKKMPDHLGLIRLFNRSRKLRPDWLVQYQIDWPSGLEPRWQYVLPDSHRMSFRTLSSQFYVIGRPFQRPKLYNEQLPIHRLSIMDKGGHLVGYVDIPDPANRPIKLGLRDFVVLSRSTANGQYEPEPDALGGSRRRKELDFSKTPLEHRAGMTTQAVMENHSPLTKPNTTHEIGNFDTEMFPEDRPWCMFNVMLISRAGGQTDISYRDTIGRIHVDAFLAHGPRQEVIDLE